MHIKIEKKSVVMITNSLNINGISEVITNYCRYLDKNKFNITVMAGSPVNEKYKEEYAQLNTKIVELPSKTNDARNYYLGIYKNLRKKKYDIVHVHGNSATMAFDLIIAKLCGVKCRIAHSHNSRCLSSFMNRIMLPVFKRVYTKGLACSSLAGEWLFGEKNFTVILNGFDYKKFCFDINSRRFIRQEIELEEEIIVGHMGRMNGQKNQEYLFEIFTELCRIRDDIRLVIVGDGPDYKKIKSLAENHPNKDKILLYGETTTPEKLYSAFDIFLFPSKYEGFGMVMTEAQTSGLPCIASTAVPKDVVISDNVTFLPIGRENISFWVDEVLRLIGRCNIENRKNVDIEKLKKFDIKENVKLLESCYEKN